MLLRIQEHELRAVLQGVLAREALELTPGVVNSVGIALWLELSAEFAALEPEAAVTRELDPVRGEALRLSLTAFAPSGASPDGVVTAARKFEAFLTGGRL